MKMQRTKSDNARCCLAKKQSGNLTCTLTAPELNERKETVLAQLRAQIIATRELSDGFAFKFPGTDRVLDELIEFIKTERECCNFFIFTLSISGDKSETWLAITGPKGSKEFIHSELGL